MNGHTARLAIAALLEFAAIVLLALVAAGRPWPAPRTAASVVVITDRSASVDAQEVDLARTAIVNELHGSPVAIDLLELQFAGKAGTMQRLQPTAAPPDADRRAALDPLATNLESALLAALAPSGAAAPATLILLSDGHATDGDTRRALEGAAAAGVPVLWRTLNPSASAPRIVEVQAPSDVQPRQEIPVIVRLGGTAAAAIKVSVAPGDRAIPPTSLVVDPGSLGNATLHLQASAPGTLLLDVELTDAATGTLLDARVAAAAIDVRPPAEILYVARGPAPLAVSLHAGGWSVKMVRPTALDALAGALGRFSAVVLDDVAVRAVRTTTWEALANAVHDQGTGLLVLGGAQSFAAGGYRDSRLESLLPVLSRPGALGEAAAVAFVVDKSGSMGASAAGVDRFSLAQRAVVETAATLTGRDSAGVIVFDVVPREIMPMQGTVEFQRTVSSPWPARPRGGTRLLPALELAVARLEAALPGRRFLVLVTDGFVADADDGALRARMALAGIELIALGVGPDADLSTLERLVAPERGTVLRVSEAAELPALMRSSLETRRAPIERGRLAVRERLPLPFAFAGTAGWPPVAAYAVTSPRPDATTHLESERGDPLLASRQTGLGRVVVVTAGLGPWATDWLRWSRWPALAGGLAAWVGRDNAKSDLSVSVVDQASDMRVDVEAAQGGTWVSGEASSLRVRTPSGGESAVPLAAAAPGRWSATLPEAERGLYTLSVLSPRGVQQLRHLRPARPEIGPLEPSAEIALWQKAGLVREWSPAELRRALGAVPAPTRVPTQALLLALVLFLLGILVERYAPGRGHFSSGK